MLVVCPAFLTTPWELAIVAVIVLVLFGSRLPKAMRSLGSSITEFKKGVNEGTDEESDKPAESNVESKSS